MLVAGRFGKPPAQGDVVAPGWHAGLVGRLYDWITTGLAPDAARLGQLLQGVISDAA